MPWTSLHASYDNPMHAAYKVECLTCVSCRPTPPQKIAFCFKNRSAVRVQG